MTDAVAPTPLKEQILELVRQRDHVSFAELDRLVPGFGGGMQAMLSAKYENVFFWAGLTNEGYEALDALLQEQAVRFAPASVLVYMIDGEVPKHPVVKRARAYKKPHWAPVVLRLGKHAAAGAP
jgi:hypothetical protein